MAGRAGRPHLDPYGESVLIAKDLNTVGKLFEFYIEAGAEEVESQCADENALCAHTLSLIATGFADDLPALTAFMERTFYAHQHPRSRSMARIVEESIRFLTSAKMIREDGEDLRATSLGALVSQLYLDPHGARMILDTLTTSKDLTDIGILHLICTGPDMPRLFLKAADTQYLKSFLYKNADDLSVPLPYDAEGEQIWLSALKTALVLTDWADEASEAKIEERYGIGAGDIYNVVDSAKWLLHAADRLVGMELPEFRDEIAHISTRVQHGVKAELLPLVRLKNIGRIRARRLFNAGITSPTKFRDAGPAVLTRILGKHLAKQLLTKTGGHGISGTEMADDNLVRDDDLTSLPGIGEKMAEKLRESGINSPADLLKSEFETIARIIGSKRAEKVISTLSEEGKNSELPDDQKREEPVRKGQWSISDFT